jgi:novobiocin biosynthesis protein NovU/D-mycarose 3-C-methyltransferase
VNVTKERPLGAFSRRSNCRVCGSHDLVPILDYGTMPLAGNFVWPQDIDTLKYYPLDLCVCRSCSLMQVPNVVDSKVIFSDYRYLSSVTQTLTQHFEDYADTLIARGLAGAGKFVVEIGCNDGVLLGPLKMRGAPALGIDAASNVAEVARGKGFDVTTGFFGEQLARRVREERGPADVITASNVFAHVDDLDDIMRGVRELLAPDGSFIVEVHYGLDLLETLQFDTVYHEHLCYYSITALDVINRRFGLEIYDVQRLPMHGGAIRVYSRRNDAKDTVPSAALLAMRDLELRAGIADLGTYLSFAERVVKARDAIRNLILDRRSSGRRISAFGAAGRATIMLNYCGIDHDTLEYIVDESPSRIGRIVPGVSVPILPLSHLYEDPTDDCFVTAWNYRNEIVRKAARYREGGGALIIPLPRLEIVLD